ncbi:hypothetical protein SAMN06265375_102163 [Muriicola jejuensis]|uniref:Uncharacterized protein n=1 Tax=Muriicola jejuensis TaxID=504488 RepID=A0A6P0UC66_9FLAO|nr:hypothetical protein [Muriicola jejuensis]NER10855.1 hypothetical protein [Muriicola jejuensis]SMP15924.1 hypothetical protein SAMN06265375_102163 [Muriicola jejuensis]
MAQPPKKDNPISRRGLLPLLGTTLLLPFLGFSKEEKKTSMKKNEGEEQYETLLKPDGTIVKVKVNTLKKSKVVKKNIPNSTFLKWLDKKS